MIEELKPYSKYKDSGVTWLGTVPQHWEVLPLGGRLAERKEKNSPIKTTELLSLSLKTGVIPYSEKEAGGNKAKEDLSAYILAYPGDIVVNSMNVVVGSVGLSKYFGAVSPVYFVLYPRLSDDLVAYYNAVFHVVTFQRSLFGLGNGIMYIESRSSGKLNTIRLRIPFSKLKRVLIPSPPPVEQAAIVRFLDLANGKIERTIRAKRKLIALLNEQKQAIIYRAVTRGLNPAVKLKPSGIPWLGDVPEHWEVRRNSYLFDERNERGRTGLPILVVSLRTGVTEGSDIDEDGREKRLIADVTKYKLADKGDIAYNMMRMWQGAVGVVPVPGMVSPAYVVAKPRPGVLSAYFDHLFHTDDCKNEVNRHSRGIVTDRNRLYWDQFKRLFFPLPPYTEQQEITAWIESETSTLNFAIARTEREIALIREYRTTLTAEVVTGKLDVREAAKLLPAAAEEPLPADELPEDDLSDDGPEESA